MYSKVANYIVLYLFCDVKYLYNGEIRKVFIMEIKEIQMSELESKISSGESLNIIDVREDFEVQFRMIDGAEHIPMNDVPNRLDEFDQDQKYYIVCKSGGRSADVAMFLNQHDIDAVNVDGGMMEYKGGQ